MKCCRNQYLCVRCFKSFSSSLFYQRSIFLKPIPTVSWSWFTFCPGNGFLKNNEFETTKHNFSPVCRTAGFWFSMTSVASAWLLNKNIPRQPPIFKFQNRGNRKRWDHNSNSDPNITEMQRFCWRTNNWYTPTLYKQQSYLRWCILTALFSLSWWFFTTEIWLMKSEAKMWQQTTVTTVSAMFFSAGLRFSANTSLFDNLGEECVSYHHIWQTVILDTYSVNVKKKIRNNVPCKTKNRHNNERWWRERRRLFDFVNPPYGN